MREFNCSDAECIVEKIHQMIIEDIFFDDQFEGFLSEF